MVNINTIDLLKAEIWNLKKENARLAIGRAEFDLAMEILSRVTVITTTEAGDIEGHALARYDDPDEDLDEFEWDQVCIALNIIHENIRDRE